jgi:hypothetical protein
MIVFGFMSFLFSPRPNCPKQTVGELQRTFLHQCNMSGRNRKSKWDETPDKWDELDNKHRKLGEDRIRPSFAMQIFWDVMVACVGRRFQ